MKFERYADDIIIHCQNFRMVHLRLSDLAAIIADKVRGWIHYCGKARMSELHYVFRFLNKRLAKWVRNKYRRFRRKHWFFAVAGTPVAGTPVAM